MNTSVERFTRIVQDYIKYRPSYPQEVLHVLVDECNLTPDTIIADIGSGTGLLSKLFLDYGCTVYCVEPNQAMRSAAEQSLKNHDKFHSIDGSAETTLLSKNSVDIITAGTAFHWFDAGKAKDEFKRILKPPGWVLLAWNVRNLKDSALMREYEEFIYSYSTDYSESQAVKFDKTAVNEFFYPNVMKIKTYKYVQYFDWEGFKGRLLSASYSLTPADNRYEQMLRELKQIFDRFQTNGTVEFLYETKMYYGYLHSRS